MTKRVVPVFTQDETTERMQCFSPLFGIEDAADFMIPPRVVDDFILLYVTQGVFFCEQADKMYAVSEGSYMLIDLRVRHSYYFKKELPSEIYWMHLHGRQVEHTVDLIDRLSPLPLIGKDPAVLELIKTAHALHTEADADAFSRTKHLMNTMLYLLEQVYRRQLGQNVSESERRFRAQFEHILQTTDPAELTLDDVCEQMCMSKYYFSHRFRQYYGVPPMRYITEKKLQKAKQLLRVSGMKVSAIAAECGFSTPEYFSKVFRREYGIAPDEFRRTGI